MNAASRPLLFRALRTIACLALLATPALFAQNLLPNPGFEDGTNGPAGWRIGNGGGEWITSATAMVTGNWTTNAHTGRRAIAVTGDGKNFFAWRTGNLQLQPGGLYRLKFFGRAAPGTSGGCVVSGTSRVNRDFHFTEEWAPYSFTFSNPHDVTNDYIRLGQWEVRGTVFFDDVSLVPVLVTHECSKPFPLGYCEQLVSNRYEFRADYSTTSANFHRPLYTNRCSFNSDRWVFSDGAELIYRHAVTNCLQAGARLKINLNYYVSGELIVEYSQRGKVWTPLARFNGERRSGTVELPPDFIPSYAVFIRLTAGPKSNFQVNGYEYEAEYGREGPDVNRNRPGRTRGQSQFFAVNALSTNVTILEWSPGVRNDISMGPIIEFRSTRSGLVSVDFKLDGRVVGEPDRFNVYADRPARQGRPLPGWLVGAAAGPHRIGIEVAGENGEVLLSGESEFKVGLLSVWDFGHWIEASSNHKVWWCESGWKVGENRAPPAVPPGRLPEPITISAARGETEAVQIILRPESDDRLVSVKVGPLKSPDGYTASVTSSAACVEYVSVVRPTDGSCEPGVYPDPLPPLGSGRSLPRYRNQPIWLSVSVTPDTLARNYLGNVEIQTERETLRLPLALRVYDFELPRETHLKSAFGLGTHDINRYHALTNRAQREAVFEKYLQNFAEHRIAPYSFFDYAPIDIRFTGEGTNKRAVVDFTKFDVAARKWLDEQHLSTFMLPLRGMGGGTFHSRHLGSLEGFKEGTPEFARLFQDYLSQIERHLRERGWLDKAFTYWFDEPDPKDYAFVVDGMKRIRSAAPGIRRMLTEQPEKELLGHVEIWCGLTPEWTPEKVKARRDAGEEVWWYVCTGPKAPYVTLFIDHPGTEMRLWPWQSWQYGVQGLLVWQTTYWTSDAAFPPPQLQDPWADPMGYVSGYDFKAGHVGYWGNGDGRFLYPPKRDYVNDKTPCLDGPVNSIRWENLRDGMEDYEYFWLLDQAVRKAEKAGTHRELLAEARGLLKVPEEISKDLTHFTTDPRLLLAHRDKVARMIERLQR